MAPRISTISGSDLADDLGVSLRRVQQLAAQGMPSRMVNGERRFVRREAFRWVREQDKAKAARGDGDKPNEADERALKMRAERHLKELEYETERRRLIPIDEYQQRLDDFVGGFAAVAAGRLTPFERDIVQATDAPTARKITQRIHAALMAGAQEYGEQIDAEARALEAAGTDESEAA